MEPPGLDLDWLTPLLAIGGRVPPGAGAVLADRLRIRAVVDLRKEACDDAGELARHRIAFLHLPTPDMTGPTRADLDAGVAFVSARLARAERVLVHCQHGIGRCATLALCVLVAQGMPPIAALERAKAARARVSPSPAQYDAWADWLARRGGPPAPDFDAFAAIAYRHLAA